MAEFSDSLSNTPEVYDEREHAIARGIAARISDLLSINPDTTAYDFLNMEPHMVMDALREEQMLSVASTDTHVAIARSIDAWKNSHRLQYGIEGQDDNTLDDDEPSKITRAKWWGCMLHDEGADEVSYLVSYSSIVIGGSVGTLAMVSKWDGEIIVVHELYLNDNQLKHAEKGVALTHDEWLEEMFEMFGARHGELFVRLILGDTENDDELDTILDVIWNSYHGEYSDEALSLLTELRAHNIQARGAQELEAQAGLGRMSATELTELFEELS